MTPETVMSLGAQAIQLTLLVSAPLLLVALMVGLVISIFQAATQINEATLSFIPKLVAVFVALIVGGPWMLAQLVAFIRQLYASIPQLVG